MTKRERLYGWLSGWLLVRAGLLAKKRGDEHEFIHIGAALKAGNTGPNSHTDGCLALHVFRGVKPE